jgi:hypothetical protein
MTCRKNCSVYIKWKMPVFYNGVPELSLALLFLYGSITQPLTHLTQNEISKSLLPEGIFERFPPDSPTLFNCIEWVV